MDLLCKTNNNRMINFKQEKDNRKKSKIPQHPGKNH